MKLFETVRQAPAPLHSVPATSKVKRRVAIDWGSGSMRFRVADVALGDTPTQSRLVHTYSAGVVPLLLMEDISLNNGRISASMLDAGCAAIERIKEHVREYGPQEFSGVGTAAFRKALNGHELLERVQNEQGVRILLVNQEMEAEIGFLTALQELTSNRHSEKEVTENKNIVVWDVGNGSFQITTTSTFQDQKYNDYSGALGNQTTLAILLEILKKDATQSPNPTPEASVHELVKKIQEAMAPVPVWLKEKLSNHSTQVITISGDFTIFGTFALLTGKTTNYTKEDVWREIVNLCNKSDMEISPLVKGIEPHKALTKLALLYATMDHLNITPNFSINPDGNTSGIITLNALWK